MSAPGPAFHELARERLLPVALETMHVGHLLDRALMPQVAIAARDVDVVDQVAIAEWMGASPVYTGRMRRLMQIEGDGVDAIIKALQLDVGFPHQYMDVGWKLIDAQHGEFWLRHCGALMDVEPHGEKRVIGMCHTIEDPTFDATAYATNPRARIRPLHRPPRTPADRKPHCHWTIEIDPANEPVQPIAQTQAVAQLALARVPNEREPEARARRHDRLSRRARPRVPARAVSRPRRSRRWRASSSSRRTCSRAPPSSRSPSASARARRARSWPRSGTRSAGSPGPRLARALGLEGRGAEAVAAVLRLGATLPPGFTRAVRSEGEPRPARARARERRAAGSREPRLAGPAGARQRAAASRCSPNPSSRARVCVALDTRDGRIAIELSIDPSAPAAEAPPEAAFMRLSTATAFVFDTSAQRLGR